MKISKKDALMWLSFFAQLDSEEPLGTRQTELFYAILSQIETAVTAKVAEKRAAIPGLRSLEGRTTFVGPEDKFPKGCKSCLLGTGLGAVRRTNKCNLKCPFCYDYGEWDHQPPIGEDLWEIGGTRFRKEDLPLLMSIQKKPSGICYVYLEPFMEIEQYAPVIAEFARQGVYQHMYTNGTLATRENLKLLADSGLNELRFNLGATNCADKVIEAIGIAKEYFPMVGIETPMTREFWDSFHEKKEKILATGVDFMNLAELHLNENNLPNYAGEPMYITRMGYVSPIMSHMLTLDLMKEAAEEKWPMVLHDCCNMTKFARDLNLRAHEGGWFGSSAYGCEFGRIPPEIFLPTLEDEAFTFVEEEELPKGYRPGDIVL